MGYDEVNAGLHPVPGSPRTHRFFWGRSTGTPSGHKSIDTAISDAAAADAYDEAQTSKAAFETWLGNNHSGIKTWYDSQSSAIQSDIYDGVKVYTGWKTA